MPTSQKVLLSTFEKVYVCVCVENLFPSSRKDFRLEFSFDGSKATDYAHFQQR